MQRRWHAFRSRMLQQQQLPVCWLPGTPTLTSTLLGGAVRPVIRQVACGLLLHPILSQRAVRGRQQRPLTSVLKQSSLHYLLTKTRKKKMNSRKASVGINTSNLIYCKLYVCHPRVARGSKFWDPTTRNLDPTQPNLVPTNFPDFLDPTRWDSRTTRDQSQNIKSCFV